MVWIKNWKWFQSAANFEMLKVGVPQGSALSPLFFILVMEEATRECRKGAPWEMLYDDLVLTTESKDEVKSIFMKSRDAIEL